MNQANTTHIVSGPIKNGVLDGGSIEVGVTVPPPQPLPDRPTYMDALVLFRDYIEARRQSDHATALAIEGLVLRTQENGGPQDNRSWFVVPRETAEAFEDTVAAARMETKANKVRAAINNPEGVDPQALGRLLEDLLKVCNRDAEVAGRLLHAGY